MKCTALILLGVLLSPASSCGNDVPFMVCVHTKQTTENLKANSSLKHLSEKKLDKWDKKKLWSRSGKIRTLKSSPAHDSCPDDVAVIGYQDKNENIKAGWGNRTPFLKAYLEKLEGETLAARITSRFGCAVNFQDTIIVCSYCVSNNEIAK